MPDVAGASVSDCTEGGEADHGATCTWTAEATHTCSNTGAITCSDGVFSQTPSCDARLEEGLGLLTSLAIRSHLARQEVCELCALGRASAEDVLRWITFGDASGA